jgi:hypothetical protein
MALTATRIKNAGPGRHGDDRGLYLQVTRTRGRSAVFGPKTIEYGPGSVVTLPVDEINQLRAQGFLL